MQKGEEKEGAEKYEENKCLKAHISGAAWWIQLKFEIGGAPFWENSQR